MATIGEGSCWEGNVPNTQEDVLEGDDISSKYPDGVDRERGGAQTRMKRRCPDYWKRKCLKRKRRWTCEGEKAWRVYSKLFAEKEERLEAEDKLKRRKPAEIPTFPRILSGDELSAHHPYFPLSGFHEERRTELPNRLDRDKKIRIWRNMRARSQTDASGTEGDSEEEERRYGSSRDLVAELKEDFGDLKELGHARIPRRCPDARLDLLVDRALGENPGLVEGDYLLVEFARGGIDRAHANVCLRGLRGMHLPELGTARSRRKTSKFCLYQALVALLAKTQLRYKYARSANIDYIYEHGWMLFVHIGTINLRRRQRLDDLVVYNYKYSVELELLGELTDVPLVETVGFDYREPHHRRQTVVGRKELMDAKCQLGWEKLTDHGNDEPVHEGLRRIEEWFDALPPRYRNCIFRTSRFSLAFWRDGLFWYLYNPYRCDEFGFWDDNGAACIVKFCTRRSLKRHLMILLLRAYVYVLPGTEKSPDVEPTLGQEEEVEGKLVDGQGETLDAGGEAEITVETKIKEEPEEMVIKREPEEVEAKEEMEFFNEVETKGETDGETDDKETGEKVAETPEVEEKFYAIEIYNLIYHCCQVHNAKVLQRGRAAAALERAKKRPVDDCPFDPLDARDPCAIEIEEGDCKESIEKPTWLKLYKPTWARCAPLTGKNRGNGESKDGKTRWHQYFVEESNKLFSLWGEIHISDGIFERANRGMQSYACYVVCAGMTRITAPEYWTSKTLDVIVMCGDRYYTQSRAEAEFKSAKSEYGEERSWRQYLTSHFKIGESLFEARVLPAVCGRLYVRNERNLWRSVEQLFLRHHFGILTCESSCLGLFKFCGAYYLCDVGSYGPPLFSHGRGAAYVLRATYFLKFMSTLILTIGSPECSRFALNPVEILKVVDVGDTPRDSPARRKTRGRDLEACPLLDDRKRRLKSWKQPKRSTNRLFCKAD